jgi:hypothetical protein
VWRIRSRTRIGASTGRPTKAPGWPARYTVRSRQDGIQRATGSSSEIRPFLDQHHQGDARDRLGHRVDAEDGVFLEALVLRQRRVAEHAAVHELAVAGHEQQRAGQEAGST